MYLLGSVRCSKFKILVFITTTKAKILASAIEKWHFVMLLVNVYPTHQSPQLVSSSFVIISV